MDTKLFSWGSIIIRRVGWKQRTNWSVRETKVCNLYSCNCWELLNMEKSFLTRDVWSQKKETSIARRKNEWKTVLYEKPSLREWWRGRRNISCIILLKERKQHWIRKGRILGRHLIRWWDVEPKLILFCKWFRIIRLFKYKMRSSKSLKSASQYSDFKS